jgi:hypothetical protein
MDRHCTGVLTHLPFSKDFTFMMIPFSGILLGEWGDHILSSIGLFFPSSFPSTTHKFHDLLCVAFGPLFTFASSTSDMCFIMGSLKRFLSPFSFSLSFYFAFLVSLGLFGWNSSYCLLMTGWMDMELTWSDGIGRAMIRLL